jgi:hypothetical protein
MAVKLVRLTNGEEVIFDVGTDTENTVEMKNPQLVQIVPQGPDTYGIAMLPYSPAVPSGSHILNKKNIMSETETPADLEKAYIQRTSGIEIVTSL